MNLINNTEEDFRLKLYQNYVSDYKKVTSAKSDKDKKSDYEIYKRRYLPLLREYSKDCKIIEVGCGNGYVMQFFREEGFTNIYGIDISEEQITEAVGKGLNAEVKNIFEFFKTNKEKFDIVLTLDFVEHFSKDELPALFSGLNDLLNKDGSLIIHTPNGEGFFPGRIIYGDLTHLTIFNPTSLLQILLTTGFRKVRFYEVMPIAKNIKGAVRLVLWKIIRFIIRISKIIETGIAGKILSQSFVCSAKKI
ncbi:MAG TPA: class I SAM-dependent methyltransferase [Ignavibacteriaceae bacterium]|nr:class I SAM-dependent methyltransferase [Ignavibacteriaceae bacterium]